MKNIILEIQETQKTLSKVNVMKTTSKHIRIKLLKTKLKEEGKKNLKSC